MSIRQRYGRGYAGRPPSSYTDVEQAEMLGLRPGDELPAHGNQYPNRRMGRTVVLTAEKPRATVVASQVFREPRPIAFQLRFSVDGVNFSRVMPAGGGVDVTLYKSFDIKAGIASESFGIDPTFAQPMCMVIARQLTIVMKRAETAISDVYVQAVACETNSVDCNELIDPATNSPTPAGFTMSPPNGTRYPANASLVSGAADSKRAILIFANMAAVDLFVNLGDDNVDPTPGSERASIVLPGGVSSGFSIDNYRGAFSFQYADGSDATNGYALVTIGRYP